MLTHQREGVHYNESNIAAPVTNACSCRIALTLMASKPDWIAEIVDVDGAFLQGRFVDGEILYIEVPAGFHEYYDDDVVLRLNVPIYGTKQAAACFYQLLVKKLKSRSYERSKADPCFYFIITDGRLSLMLSWVDDILIMGTPGDVQQIKSDLMSVFECKDEGALVEYAGSKIDITRKSDGLACHFCM